MASDKKAPAADGHIGTTQTSSTPKPPQISAIPKIVLDEEDSEVLPSRVKPNSNSNSNASSSCPFVSQSPSSTSSSSSPVRTCNSHHADGQQPAGVTATLPRSGISAAAASTSSTPGGCGRLGRNQIPVRSSSDIGLPATSMPNLAMQMGVAGGGGVVNDPGSENYLGVYCSPRTSRKSVDLDINSKEETRGQYEWIETLDSSSNSLQVLTASSRVGSALSLNSECTTRSIGLLSNDSDSDDLSLSEKDRPVEKATSAQLRRYLSYPEESHNPDTSARPSQSLCNLKQVDSASKERALRTGKSLDCSMLDRRSDARFTCSSNYSSDTPGSQASDQDETPYFPANVNVTAENVRDFVDENEMDAVKKRLNSVGLKKPSGFKKTDNILCYKCDANTSSRDGRIRQWLQDMDRHDYTD